MTGRSPSGPGFGRSSPGSRATLSLRAVSPENTMLASSVSKRKANDGKTGGCRARVAVTRTRSSWYTGKGGMSGA
jgi:hypothetical protein